ncbi:MAG: hypothetical protein NT079_05675 [Candidatus Omnitrophica bacterium]|nr:hypothetical protein [Candidatus Omnitrophota bacterium]
MNYLTDPKLKLTDIQIVVGVGTHSSGLPPYEEMKNEAEQRGIKVLEPMDRAERTSLRTVTTSNEVLFSDGTSPHKTQIRKWGVGESQAPVTPIIPVNKLFNLKGVGPCQIYSAQTKEEKEEMLKEWFAQATEPREFSLEFMKEFIKEDSGATVIALKLPSGKILGIAIYNKQGRGIRKSGEVSTYGPTNVYHLCLLEVDRDYRAQVTKDGQVIEKGKGIGVVFLAYVIEKSMNDPKIKESARGIVTVLPTKKVKAGKYYENLGFQEILPLDRKSSGDIQRFYSSADNSKKILVRAEELVSSNMKGDNGPAGSKIVNDGKSLTTALTRTTSPENPELVSPDIKVSYNTKKSEFSTKITQPENELVGVALDDMLREKTEGLNKVLEENPEFSCQFEKTKITARLEWKGTHFVVRPINVDKVLRPSRLKRFNKKPMNQFISPEGTFGKVLFKVVHIDGRNAVFIEEIHPSLGIRLIGQSKSEETNTNLSLRYWPTAVLTHIILEAEKLGFHDVYVTTEKQIYEYDGWELGGISPDNAKIHYYEPPFFAAKDLGLSMEKVKSKVYFKEKLVFTRELYHISLPAENTSGSILINNGTRTTSSIRIIDETADKAKGERPASSDQKILDLATGIQKLKTIKYPENKIEIAKQLGVDTRPAEQRLLDVQFVGLDMAIKKQVNPDNKPLKAVYAGAAADISNLLYATNATEMYFLNEYSLAQKDFELYLDLSFWKDDYFWSECQNSPYMQHKFMMGWSKYDEVDGVNKLAMALLMELRSIGVERQDIKVSKTQDGFLRVNFKWIYPGTTIKKDYAITFIGGDVNDLLDEKFTPPTLTEFLDNGIDVFFMKAGNKIVRGYAHFMSRIGNSMNDGGFCITDDVDNEANEFDLEPYLEKDGAKFTDTLANPEKEQWEKLLPKIDARYGIETGKYGNWLNIRQKVSSNMKTSLITREQILKVIERRNEFDRPGWLDDEAKEQIVEALMGGVVEDFGELIEQGRFKVSKGKPFTASHDVAAKDLFVSRGKSIEMIIEKGFDWRNLRHWDVYNKGVWVSLSHRSLTSKDLVITFEGNVLEGDYNFYIPHILKFRVKGEMKRLEERAQKFGNNEYPMHYPLWSYLGVLLFDIFNIDGTMLGDDVIIIRNPQSIKRIEKREDYFKRIQSQNGNGTAGSKIVNANKGSVASDIKGGIDFNKQNMNVETKGEGVKSLLGSSSSLGSLSSEQNPTNTINSINALTSDDITGFIPVIINIVPVTDFAGLLGLSKQDIEGKAAESKAESPELSKSEALDKAKELEMVGVEG